MAPFLAIADAQVTQKGQAECFIRSLICLVFHISTQQLQNVDRTSIKHNYRNQIKKNEMDENVAHVGQKRGAYRALMGKHEEKRPLGRPRRRWEDNIKTDIQKIKWVV